ncbi:adenylate kinase [Engelhardtia mirabilis]|uniref:Adenylate kinase n=1 Tax=Engelhardtia mirabilis TaxID=2528011 RepID=A0A518BPB8_9BACT|nr:Adenylate kinase [Planctomycetes bacterium Pla133]QDV03147.1 Adenylate kinase [Planctomycetes bacterium Pla86]
MSKTVVILLGAPGAGKGTQARRLAEAEGLPHVATGDLFRANLSRGTALGDRAKKFMDAGELVPDDLVIEMLFDRVSQDDCRDGYLLDGFPRTLPQAEALSKALGETQVRALELAVPDSSIVERAAGRLLCRNCTNIHHRAFAPPAVAGKCDACGGELYQRDDDQPDVVRERLNVYHRETEPVSRFYGERGVLTTVDGSLTPDEVFASLRSALRGEARS